MIFISISILAYFPKNQNKKTRETTDFLRLKKIYNYFKIRKTLSFNSGKSVLQVSQTIFLFTPKYS